MKFERTALLIGKKGLEILKSKSVMVFGLGGVGSFAAEALARAGVGSFVLVDHDKIEASNINRQLLALHSTIGQYKVDLMKKRILDINPEVKVEALKEFFSRENADKFWNYNPDYIVDAIDTVSSKVYLIKTAIERRIPIVSSMGTGNRLNPAMLKLADISETKICPLARIVRRELRKEGIKSGLDVVFSTERPIETSSKRIPGSISTVPPVSGFILASRVVNYFLNTKCE